MDALFITWNPDVVAVDLGFFAVRWYSLCWCLGLVGVYLLMHHLYRQQKISEEQFEPMFMYCFLGILIGARLGHCFFYEPEYYSNHLIETFFPIKEVYNAERASAFLSWVPCTHGGAGWTFIGYEGLASHGGTIGLMIALCLYARNQKLNLMHVLDNVGIVTPICACAIRMGNLMNSEIIGRPTDVPWAFIFERVDALPRHPGQLYEALCYALFFFVGWAFYRSSMSSEVKSEKRKVKSVPQVGTGFYFGLCLFMIFTSRIFIEYTKENQVSFEDGMLMNMGQLLSVPFVLLGAYCMWRACKAQNNKI